MSSFKLKDYQLKDTIAAIATFPSKSALGVVKISGKKAIPIISKIFKPAKPKNLRKVRNYTIHYGWIVERCKVQGSRFKEGMVDEVLVSVMRGPSSYTKEDVVEISSHGGVWVLNKILAMVRKEGGRLALPGEFTYRALVSGRIDLLQAQSILGIVDAKSDTSLTLATGQLRGEASKKIKKLKEEIKGVFVQTESLINFPEDEIDICLDLGKAIGKLEKKVNDLIEGSNEARVIREGLKCVICGKTNAGKSTLFNRLLREERVIVSKLSGTTRDVIEETINIKGVPLRIFDTAGILEPKDLITKKALEKTSKAFKEADLVILLLDASRRLERDDFFLLAKAKGKNTILVVNKMDLTHRLDFKKIKEIKATIVKMSALKDTGLRRLEEAIHDNVYKPNLSRENIIFLSQYQQEVLKEISNKIQEALNFLKEERPLDFINFSLKVCLDNIGKLSGEVYSEEILDSIFSQFCIGK
jgi:tRNA modification GTPase